MPTQLQQKEWKKSSRCQNIVKLANTRTAPSQDWGKEWKEQFENERGQTLELQKFIAALNSSKHCSADVAVGIFRVSATVLAACQQTQLSITLEIQCSSSSVEQRNWWLTSSSSSICQWLAWVLWFIQNEGPISLKQNIAKFEPIKLSVSPRPPALFLVPVEASHLAKGSYPANLQEHLAVRKIHQELKNQRSQEKTLEHLILQQRWTCDEWNESNEANVNCTPELLASCL